MAKVEVLATPCRKHISQVSDVDSSSSPQSNAFQIATNLLEL